MKIKIKNLIQGGLVSVILSLMIFSVAKAGDIAPPSGTPTAQFYTLSEIYNFITNNTTATEGGHSFTFSDSLAGTSHTLTEIYNALAGLISADKVKLGTTYLNVAGALAPDGGTAGAADLFNGKTAHLTGDWSLDAGTLNLACNIATFDGTGNLVSDTYDGGGNGNNRWCVTDADDITAADVLFGKIAWINGVATTGSMADNGAFGLTASSSDQSVTAGYYSGGTLAGDGDLIAANIKSGVNIFGVAGSHLASPTYGDDDADQVLNTAANPGTYDPNTCSTTYDTSNLTVGTVKSGITFGDGLTGEYPSATYPLSGDTGATDATAADMKTGVEAWTKAGALITGSGTQTLSSASETVDAGYYDATTLSTADGDLAAGNIKSGITIFGISGNSNVVDTSSGDAVNSEILSGKKAWVDGSEITGSVADCSSEGSQNCYTTGTYYAGTSKTPSNSATSQSAGYYPAFDLATVDTDLVASNIGANVGIFGVSGTLLKNLYNGSAASGDYPQNVGGVDDYNDGGSIPNDSYAGSWTTCDIGNDYCQTDDATYADAKDDSADLVWSKWLDSGTTHTWFWANNCEYPNGLPGDDGTCDIDGEVACKCVKKTSSKTGCEAIGDGNWRLPYQKELMQAYINGSWDNLSSAGNYYWSATTTSYATHYAWIVYLNHGTTYSTTKTSDASSRVRCVR